MILLGFFGVSTIVVLFNANVYKLFYFKQFRSAINSFLFTHSLRKQHTSAGPVCLFSGYGCPPRWPDGGRSARF